MKNIYFLLAVSLLIASCGPTTVVQSDPYQPASAPPPEENVSYQSFYDELSPYGSWINYPGYGYVWMPNVGPDFQPYATNGNWLYTDAGWTWASDYNWGWAPFHYGRWFYDNGYGWMWVPGNEWAPAWVSWRGGGDYYGWAPLQPGISVDVALSNYNPPANYWNFVPRQYIGNSNWHNYYVSGGRNVTIINNTTVINNYSGTNRNRYGYAPGPDPNEARRYSGNNFTPVQLRQSSTPGARRNGSQYVIYQPRVNSSTDARGNAGRPAPARYQPYNNNNGRPSAQNPPNNQPANNQPGNNQRPAYNQPANNQPVNNPRPTYNQPAQNAPANNQPANNPRSDTYNPPANNPRSDTYNPPANNQPVNNPRPATTNPAYNPPANNPRPAYNQPANNQPVNNPRPATPNPAYTPPANNKPANNPRTAPQSPDTRGQNTQPVQPSNQNMNDRRLNQYNHSQPAARPVPTYTPPQRSPVNTPQTTGRPVGDRNPPPGVKPVQRAGPVENKPAPQPKTREADSKQ
ncbi:MAG TPA: DUF6600 domain-containing protein [Puia sp.]